MQLWQAINETIEPGRRGVRLAVPGDIIIRLAQAKVRAEVNDAGRQPSQLFDTLLRGAMRQAAEKHVHGLQLAGCRELQPRPAAQIRMDEVHEAARVALRRNLGHVRVWMIEQQAQQFAAGVAGTAQDGHAQALAHGPTSDAPGAPTGKSAGCQPLAAAQPSRATRTAKSTMRPGISTPVGSIELRNSIV